MYYHKCGSLLSKKTSVTVRRPISYVYKSTVEKNTVNNVLEVQETYSIVMYKLLLF